MKKRGFGAGRWNGFGGKVHDGEDATTCAVRELEEEAGITPLNLVERGFLHFDYEEGSSAPDERLEVRLFAASAFRGTPQESEEMRPQWFSLDTIPYDAMWPDDIHWLPYILQGASVQGQFVFGEQDVIIHHTLHVY